MKAAYHWCRVELRKGEFGGPWPEPWATIICCVYAVTARKFFREEA